METFDALRHQTMIIQNGRQQSGIATAFNAATKDDSLDQLSHPVKHRMRYWMSHLLLNHHLVVQLPDEDIKPPIVLLPSTYASDSSAFIEHYLEQNLSQSHMDKRNGSSACTAIATLTAHRVLVGTLLLPSAKGAYPPVETIQVFVACMRQGNYICDSTDGMNRLLWVSQALTALSNVGVKIQQEFLKSTEGLEAVDSQVV